MKLRVPKHAKPGECAATEDELREHAEGLVCLTGDEYGPLAAALEMVGPKKANAASIATGIFGERHLYIEVQRHYDRREEARNQIAIELARSYGMPLLATNAPRYASHSSVRSSTSSPASESHRSTSQESYSQKIPSGI